MTLCSKPCAFQHQQQPPSDACTAADHPKKRASAHARTSITRAACMPPHPPHPPNTHKTQEPCHAGFKNLVCPKDFAPNDRPSTAIQSAVTGTIQVAASFRRSQFFSYCEMEKWLAVSERGGSRVVWCVQPAARSCWAHADECAAAWSIMCTAQTDSGIYKGTDIFEDALKKYKVGPVHLWWCSSAAVKRSPAERLPPHLLHPHVPAVFRCRSDGLPRAGRRLFAVHHQGLVLSRQSKRRRLLGGGRKYLVAGSGRPTADCCAGHGWICLRPHLRKAVWRW